MTEGIKIATIGGGSSYTPELIEGFLRRYDSLPVRELWLVDVPEGQAKLEIVAGLAKRMVKRAGVPMRIITTLDRRAALKGADFVTTQLRVGQLQARIKDERIPLSHGILGQETNGAGGLFNGLRTIPVIMDICRDMQELCPDAWLINFTNPVGMVMEGIHRYTGFRKIIGLCNVPIGMHKAIASLLNRKEDGVSVKFGGLNHMVFATQVIADGQDVTKKVLRLWGDQSVKNIKGVVWNPDFIQELGVLPCSYHRYYYMTREYLEEELDQYSRHEVRAEFVKGVEDKLFKLYQDETLCEKPKLLEERGGAFYSDAACSLIDSIHNDRGDIQVVNTVNNGAIDNFGPDEIVEVSCKITKDGPVPIRIGSLPRAVDGLVSQIKSFEIAGSAAAVTGDRKKALLALMINPLVMSQKTAQIVLDELLEAHKDYLPLFFPKIRKMNVQEARNCRLWQLFRETVERGELACEGIEENAFYEKLFSPGEGVIPVVYGEENGNGFACGCRDEIQGKNFLTLVLVKERERGKGLGRKLTEALEKEFCSECGEKEAPAVMEISFFNPVTFSWKIPGKEANHPNMPGVDMGSEAMAFLEAVGYETFAVQNAYYLSLNDYVPDETMRRKKEELRQAGISFEIYRPGWHTGMQELLKGLGNRSWEREILAEPDTDAGGRPIIVPVQGKRVLGFTGPVEVEKSGRGYFAGIGVAPSSRGKGVAKVLFAELCGCLKEKGARFMTLFTGENNPARNIYEAAGFRAVKSFADMRKTPES